MYQSNNNKQNTRSIEQQINRLYMHFQAATDFIMSTWRKITRSILTCLEPNPSKINSIYFILSQCISLLSLKTTTIDVFVCLFICLFVYLFVCLFVCLFEVLFLSHLLWLEVLVFALALYFSYPNYKADKLLIEPIVFKNFSPLIWNGTI